MDRRDKLLQGIDIAHATGVEIGALCRPFLKKTEGDVIYVDHATTEALREKYRNDSNVVLDKLVDVDAVWGANTLADAVGRRADYVVASHVVEHVPDLISWLEELHSILNDRGEVRLIVPDKRFTFDYLRAETGLADIMYARLVKARVPQPHVVLEYILNVSKIDGAKAWRGEIDEARLERHHTAELAVGAAKQVLDEGAYHDVHCWVFTPLSFARLMEALARSGQLGFKCSLFHDTEFDTIEFFVGLQKCVDREEMIQSWQSMQQEIRRKEGETTLEREQVARLERTVAALRASTSWRLTAPLRALVAAVRKLVR